VVVQIPSICFKVDYLSMILFKHDIVCMLAKTSS
jgi:hypothetical protein